MDVSIIIVNYKTPQLVIDCVKSIYKKTEGITYEVIVVDNASNDESVSIIKDELDNRVQLIKSESNLGFGKANNLGATYASGKYLFLLNPDTILVNNAIKVLYEHLEKSPEVGVAGGNLYMPEMTPAPSFCMKFDDLELEKKNASWGVLIGRKVKDKVCVYVPKLFAKRPFSDAFNYSDKVMSVAYIFGADMMMKKPLFDEVHGFEPEFFMYGEEEELTWRITQKGYRVDCVPEAKIIHLEGATVKQRDDFSERQFKMRMNGTMTYYKKRFGLRGVERFYELRSLRYERLVKIAKIQKKDIINFAPTIQKRCLDEVYKEFMSQQR